METKEKNEQYNMYLLGLENGYANIAPAFPNDNYYLQGFYEGQGHYMEMLRRYQEEQEYNQCDIIEF